MQCIIQQLSAHFLPNWMASVLKSGTKPILTQEVPYMLSREDMFQGSLLLWLCPKAQVSFAGLKAKASKLHFPSDALTWRRGCVYLVFNLCSLLHWANQKQGHFHCECIYFYVDIIKSYVFSHKQVAEELHHGYGHFETFSWPHHSNSHRIS